MHDIFVRFSGVFQKMYATQSEIHGKRPDAKDVSTPMRGDKFTFPTVKLSGGDQDLRTSTFIRTAQTEENKINLLGES